MGSTGPQSLIDAVLQQLRTTPVAAAFGDTWVPGVSPPGVMKFFGDYAGDSPEPIAVFRNPDEERTYFTAGPGGNIPYLADGHLSVAIFAPDRDQAEFLGNMMSQHGVIVDVPLYWFNATLKYLRVVQSAFVPVTQVGPSIATIFQRLLVFEYQYQGQL